MMMLYANSYSSTKKHKVIMLTGQYEKVENRISKVLIFSFCLFSSYLRLRKTYLNSNKS